MDQTPIVSLASGHPLIDIDLTAVVQFALFLITVAGIGAVAEIAVRSEDSERNRKIETGAFFPHIRGRQVDRRLVKWKEKPAVVNGRTNALARLSHGSVRQADNDHRKPFDAQRHGALLALAYCAGLGIPFVLFGLFFRKLLGFPEG